MANQGRVRRARRRFFSSFFGGGPNSNEQLTLLAGVVLLVAFVALGITVLQVRSLLRLHLLLGVFLLGPLALKLAAVGYRFSRYYTGSPPYRRKGPPPLVARALGPPFILLTLAVFGSGLVLMFGGPRLIQPWLFIHKATFILWLVLFAIHLVAHSRQLLGLLGGKPQLRGELLALLPERAPVPRAGRAGRAFLVVGGVAVGVVGAVALTPKMGTFERRLAAVVRRRAGPGLSSNRHALSSGKGAPHRGVEAVQGIRASGRPDQHL